MKGKIFFIIALCIFLTGALYGCVEEKEENKAPTCTLAANPNVGTAPITVTFTLAASDSDGSISSWKLDIDNDGNPDYSGTGNPPINKVHTYDSPGTYTAKLTVTDNEEKTGTDTITITVNAPTTGNQSPTCTLSATPSSGYAPLTVTFSMDANDPDGTITSWNLDINNDGTVEYSGAGSPSSTREHTYTNTGTYTAKLTVIDNQGANSTGTTTISVTEEPSGNQSPTCSFTANPTSGYAPLTVTFTMSASDPDGSITTWSLDINNDGTSDYAGSGAPPGSKQHTYFSTGTYTAKFTVTDNQGAPSSNTIVITVSQAPQNKPPTCSLSANPGSGYAPLSVIFTMSGNDSDGFIASWTLDIDNDGTTEYSGTGTPPSIKQHIYQTKGIYTAKLQVIDNDGLTDTDTIIITINKSPIIMTFNELANDYYVDRNYVTKEITQQFQSLDDGDTVYIQDTITNISYLQSDDYTWIEFSSSPNEIFSIAGDITNDFGPGDTVEIQVHIGTDVFTEEDPDTGEMWTYDMEVMLEGWDTENHEYVPVPQKYLSRVEGDNDEAIIMAFNVFINDYRSNIDNESRIITYYFQSLNNGDFLIIRDTINIISYNATQGYTSIEFISIVGDTFPIEGDITDEFKVGDTVEITVHIIDVSFTENHPSTGELWTFYIETFEEEWDAENKTYKLLPQEYIRHAAITSQDTIAVINTSRGVIKIKLYVEKMPITTSNFIKLVSEGFYDGLIFHRIKDDFMIQAGRYKPDESQKISPYGTIEFETHPDVQHVDGAISMARGTAYDSASAEFFICDGAQHFLDGQYAAFGVVVEGIDVVRDIASTPHDGSLEPSPGGGKPLVDIIINSIEIVTRSGYSRRNPAPIGSTLVYEEEDDWLYGDYKARITLVQVIRGTQAWTMIEDANMFNDEPDPGYEYILAKIRFEYLESSEQDAQYDLSSYDFTVVSESGVDYDVPFVVEPEPDLSASLYPGASVEGWAAYQVAITDDHPLLTFGRDWLGKGGIWFKLYPASTILLNISNLVFCSEQPVGYMDYDEKPSAQYNPGDTVWIYMNINNLHYNVNSDESSEIWIKQNLTLLDSQGEIIQNFGEVINDHRNLPKGMDPGKLFLTNNMYIPTDFDPGLYTVQILAKDALAGVSDTISSTFRIIQPLPTTFSELVIFLNTPQKVLDYMKNTFTFEYHDGCISYIPNQFFEIKRGDCKDYATFFSYILDQNDYYAEMVTFTWYDQQGSRNGHVVTIFKDDDENLKYQSNDELYGPTTSVNDLLTKEKERLDALSISNHIVLPPGSTYCCSNS